MATTDEPAQQTDAGLPISQVQLERLTQWQSGNRYREQPSYAWSFPKAIDEAAVLSAWTGLVARYENLRTVFLDDAGSLRREQRPTDATTAGTFVTTGPERFFDRLLEPLRLLGGPLTRIVHARSERETLIGVCADHLVIDGATLQMMFTDLWTLLGGAEPEGPQPLPPDEFIRAELRAARNPVVVERNLEHWRRTADGRTYPPLLPGLTRDPKVPHVPETAFADLKYDAAGGARNGLARTAEVLGAFYGEVARLGVPGGEGADRLVTLLQGARRFTKKDARTAGLLANWLVASLPFTPQAATVRKAAAGALLQAMQACDLHHAEVVRLLEPELYGARYLPADSLAPYAMVNHRAELPEARIAGTAGVPLELPPAGPEVMDGGLRVWATESTDHSGVRMRIVVDATVFGAGYAAELAAGLRRANTS